ncbi:MAG: hypothetical protein PSX37_03665 [bacterium]|nr:hypothetical protein [bacterium]
MGLFDNDDGERNKKIAIGIFFALCIGFAGWQLGKSMGFFLPETSTTGGPPGPVSTTTDPAQPGATGLTKPGVAEPPPEATPANRRRVSDPQ